MNLVGDSLMKLFQGGKVLDPGVESSQGDAQEILAPFGRQ